MTIDDKVAPFFRMFAGMGIDRELAKELQHEHALYVEAGKDEKKKKRPFLQDDVSDAVKGTIIRTTHHLERGDCRFIPEEHDLDAIRSWNAAYARAMTFFQEKAGDIFARLAGRTASAYATRHIRSEGEKQATLRWYLGEHGRLFDEEIRGQAGKLRAGKLEAHLLNQPLDMVAYLRTTPMTARAAFDGMIVRAKSADRLARKVAQNWIDIWTKYDTAKRQKRRGEVSPDDLAVSYKDFLITDQFAFALFFGNKTPFAYDFIFGDDMGFRQLELRDASTLKIRPKDGTRLRRIKLFHEREALIVDMHVDDLASFIDMQYGESPHSIMVHKQHTDALSGPYCRSYSRIYEQAYRFFLACDMPSVKPELFDLYTAERPERQRTLTSMREPILRRIDYRVDDIERLARLLRPDPSLKVRKDQDRITENRRKLEREFSRRFDKRLADIKRELETPLYDAVVGHAYALEDMLRDGASMIFDYDPTALSVDASHQAAELAQHTESMMRLHDFFYKDTPQAGYLDRQRRFIDEAVTNIRFLLERQTPVFEALQAAYDSLEEHGYTPARVDRAHRHILNAFDEANRAISETNTSYNSIASLKLDVRILLASRVIEFQSELLEQLERRRRAKDEEFELDGDSLSMFKGFRHRVDSIAYGCMDRLSDEVREAYLRRRERFDKLAGLDS